MNKTQRIVLLFTAAVLISMMLFPPFYSTQGTVKVSKGYRFILNPIKMAYWDKEAEMQAAISFEKDIVSDERWASLLDRITTLNFDFMRDPRWPTLDTATKNTTLDIAFKRDIMVAPEWKTASPEDQKRARKAYLVEADKFDQELKRVKNIYFDEQKKKYPKKIESVPPLVDSIQLLAQAIIVILVGGILWFAFKDDM